MIKQYGRIFFPSCFASLVRLSRAAAPLHRPGCTRRDRARDGLQKDRIAPVIEPPSSEEIADLIGGLKTKKRVGFIPDYRISAAGRLGDAGPAAKDAVPALEKLAQDKDPEVKAAAEKALAKIKDFVGDSGRRHR